MEMNQLGTEMALLRQTIERNDRSHSDEIQQLRELLDKKENDLSALIAEKEAVHIAGMRELETMNKGFEDKIDRMQAFLNGENVFTVN